MASHIILPPEDGEEQHRHDHDEEEDPREDEEESRSPPDQATAKAALPFSASCVRISRDSYPNLRTLRNASSSMSLADAAYVKISEGNFGYVLDDVPHLTDYLPDLPVSALTDPWLPPEGCVCSAALL
jgi:6-phosphofructokinase 1